MSEQFLSKKCFSRLLLQLRQKKNISQEELALRAGMSRQQISRLEAGKASPSFFSVHKIAMALSVSMREIAELYENLYYAQPLHQRKVAERTQIPKYQTINRRKIRKHASHSK